MEALVVGGDIRMELAGRLLHKDGWQTGRICSDRDTGWPDKVKRADVILMPYPYAVKDGEIPGWSGGGVEEVLSQAAPGAVVIAGNGLESILDSQPNPKQAFRLMHYTDAPVFSVRNAEISAEAAVSEVMQRSKRTLDELQVLVMGYGLFAKAICWRLTALGARVWVAARREQQRRQAAGDGMHAIAVEAIERVAGGMDVVINTVPAVLIGHERLEMFPDHTLFLELASPPYGIDLSAAVALEKDVVVLPGLPSRYAPMSAARAVASAVKELVKEEMV